MNDALKSLLDYLRGNWPELLWIIAAAGVASYTAGRRARRRWRNREFLNRLNVSLTSIDAGTLKIRTLLEMDCDQILLNPAAASSLVKLARQTTAEDPVIPIPQEDCWQYLNAVLNEISERFAPGHLKRDLGLPASTGEYLVCLTCERAGAVRTQKIRAMVVRKSLLLDLPKEEPQYESPNHVTRWHSLHQLAEHYRKQPYRFLDIEITL